MSGSCKPTQPTAPEAAGALRAAAAASGASVRKQLQSASPRPRPESSSFDVLLVSSLPKSFRGGSQTSESAAFAGAGGSRPARRERERPGDVALRSLRRGHHPLSDAAPRAVRSRRLHPALVRTVARPLAAPPPRGRGSHSFQGARSQIILDPPKSCDNNKRPFPRAPRPAACREPSRKRHAPRPAGASARASRESPRLALEGPVGATGPRVAFGCEFESEGPHVTVAA